MTQALLTAKSPTISTQHVVELRNVDMRFNDKQVLDDVSLVVDPQERLVIIGQHAVSRINDHESCNKSGCA
jgi:ABC-type molybdenum transport system ATPase subunit/photorepair protein PhrA